MGFNLNGYVLRPARAATGNARNTDEATTGVDRDHVYPDDFPASYVVGPTDGPVEPYADMYRAAVLLQPDARAATQEYCLFAATTGSLGVVPDPDLPVLGDAETLQVIPGNLSVGGFDDGTVSFYLRDGGARDIASAISVVINPGAGLGSPVVCSVVDFDQTTGRIEIDGTGIGGGFSEQRGDRLIASYYVLAGVFFWWTRNDPADGVYRFGWDGKQQKWLPLKGTLPRDLGAIGPDEVYSLNPPLTRFMVGDVLPGTPAEPDEYALIRVGLYPDAGATPLNVLVVSDAEADGEWLSAWDARDAVVGVTSGQLLLNPIFVEANAGRTIWYNAETFVSDSTGDLGLVADLPTMDNQGFPVLSPVPGATERPFLRIGNRQYLTPVSVATDGDLPIPSLVPPGVFYWSRTTGKIVLSSANITQCTPGSGNYEIAFLGARLYFDGVALSAQPVPVRQPSYAVDENGDNIDGVTIGVPNSGDIFVKRAVALPPPGVSGVTWVPDGSGVVPDGASTPQTRPNGSGLVRQVLAETGDTFFFNGNSGGTGYAYEDVEVVEYDDDLPVLKIKVPKTDVVVSQQSKAPPVAGASRIQLRRRPVQGDALFFRQAWVLPSVYSADARIYSRFAGPYVLTGSEVLRYAVGSTAYVWTATAAGSFTAAEVAATFPPGHAGVERGRLYLEDAAGGNIEIGWNLPESDGGPGRFDLSGHAALGFLPGWKIEPSDPDYRWLPDNGAALGVYRAPRNLDLSRSIPDIRARSRFNNDILTEDISPVPFVGVNQPPLEDVPGYAEGSHFRVRAGLLVLDLKNYQVTRDIGLKYDWPNDRFLWISEGETEGTRISFPTATLQLNDASVLPESVSSDAMQDGSYGLFVKSATSFAYTEQVRGVDFLMPGDGQPGQAVQVDVRGGVVAAGGLAQISGADFTDPFSLDLVNVEVGDLLHLLNGSAVGVYTVTAVTGSTLTVSPEIQASSGPIQWQVYRAKPRTEVDTTLLADVKLEPRDHLTDEPFKIRVLTAAGVVGSPLVVDPVMALRRGRATALRFGLASGSPEAQPFYLTRGVLLGQVAASGLSVSPLDPHVALSTMGNVFFQLRIGAQPFVPTINVGTPPVGGVDVNTITGDVLVDAGLVTSESGSLVYFDQLFLDPADLSAGECEVDSTTGDVNLSASDASAYSGLTAYYVEQMITVGDLDVTASPVNGSIFFNTPLRAGQMVEVSYFQADSNGDKKLDADGNAVEITEFLPLLVRLEVATRVTDTVFTYNPTGRTLAANVDPFVWVGVNLQNFAGEKTATVADGQIVLASPAPALSRVQINYGVLEAFGGEQAYTVSSPPVYRKPFWLDAGQSTFTLAGYRVDDFPVGHLLMVGSAPFYVETVVYDAGEDRTEVQVFPTPLVEVGSRAVGRDATLTISDFAVCVGFGADAGFMPLLNTDPSTGTPLLPVDRGSLQVAFYGDVRQYARPNHVLEIDGYPYVVISSSISTDGRNTLVDLATPVYKAHDNSQPVRISVRPVYGPNPVAFQGIAPFVPTEDYALFLMGQRDDAGDLLPGQMLVEGVHYTVDPNSGDVTFQDPTQQGLKSGEYLHFRHTALREVRPDVVDGAILYPMYRAKYLHQTTPSRRNRILNKTLRAKYTYRNPDSFYFSTMPLTTYLADVEGVSDSQGIQPVGGGPVLPFAGSTDLSKQGRLGLRGDVRDLKDQDRAARAYVTLFNATILAFEQVLEAMDGRVIGDRDGKFKFFVGRGARYVRPGWEDEITGDLQTRLIWRNVVEEWAPNSFSGWYTTADPVYDPTTAEEPEPADRPGETDGETPNPEVLEFFTRRQRRLVKNDMDDRLLIGFGRNRGLAALFPKIDVPGQFKQMWEDHVYSRLFPERTHHFTRLNPGLDAREEGGEIRDPGYYTSGRKKTIPGPNPGETTEQTVKTRGSVIGTVANPALGSIRGIVEVTAQDRLPRARVWAYYPTGSAKLNAALVAAGITPPALGYVALVATPLTLGQFPVDPETGFPDFAEFLSEGGTVVDLVSGDGDLANPGFQVGQQVAYGLPTGVVYTLSDRDGNGIFVDSVVGGCVLTLKDVSGNSLTGSQVFYNGSSPLSDVADGYGDTVFVVPVNPDVSGLTYPPTTEREIQDLVDTLPDYRIQFDLKVARRTGEFIDASLPTRDDVFPLPIQNWLGQRPPQPLSCIEGMVEFVNTDSDPARLPCLLGQDKDDSGDYQIPYIKGTDTELAVLGQVAASVELLFEDTTIVPPHLWLAVYPDEIVGLGSIRVSSYDIGLDEDPATLYSTVDLTPVATAGVYTAHSGLGDARAYDLLFVEAGQSPAGVTGILSIGSVTDRALEVPRFVTPTADAGLGYYTKFTIENAAVAVNRGGTEGVQVTETTPFVGVYETIFDFSSVSFVLDDGSGTGVGGYNSFLGTGGTQNTLIIRIYDPMTGNLLEEVAVSDPSSLGTPGAWGTVLAPAGLSFILGSPSCVGSQIILRTTAPLSSVANTGLFYDVTITVDAYVTASTLAISPSSLRTTTGIAQGTQTSSILSDRLTFTERMDLLHAAARDTVVGVTNVGTSLAVWEITVGAGVTGCIVNAPAEVNDGQPFTFLERWNSALFIPYVGTFIPASSAGAGDELGTLKVMSWEAQGNVPLSPSDLTNLKFAAAASSDAGVDSLILSGTGTMLDRTLNTVNRAWVQGVTVSTGGVDLVEPGDVLVVEGGAGLGEAAVKVGSYLVRHVVEETDTALDGTPIQPIVVEVNAGESERVDMSFPQVLTADPLAFTMTVKALPEVTESPTGHSFAATGQVYLIRNSQYGSYDSGSSTWTIDSEAVYSAQYSSIVVSPTTGAATFQIVPGSAVDAHGSSITDAAFIEAAVLNTLVSGMVYLPPRQLAPTLPENNCVGYNQGPAGNDAIAGFQQVFFGSTLIGGGSQSYSTLGSTLVRTPTSGCVTIYVPSGADSTDFYEARDRVIYPASSPFPVPYVVGVAGYLGLDQLTATEWDQQHFGGSTVVPATPALNCLLPGDKLVVGNLFTNPTIGRFFALSGVFLEPSLPLPVGDLGQVLPQVVSNAYNLTSSYQVGVRDYETRFVTPPGVGEEDVRFSVRRIRRFHEQLNQVISGLDPLKFCYQIRRGVVGSYDPASREFVADISTYGSATNLGSFDNESVNINAGDVLRILNPATGDVTDEVEVQKVTGPTTLKLRRPGLVNPLPSGALFEVYLEQAIVPHEQSNEQLLDLITDQVVFTRMVDYSAGDVDGGAVATVNEMGDTLVASWAAEGVQAGDYVVVDPAGALYVPVEAGVRPFGDQSVVERPSVHVAGAPNRLDDNRGAYRITSVDEVALGVLEVDGASRFAQGGPFGGDSGAEYVVLPTITGSLIPEGSTEGQQDLRVTAGAVSGSFRDRVGADAYRSLEPFGYRIIRPNPVFSQDAVELVLFIRERMLSWIEALNTIYGMGGDYYVFQRDNHINALGSNTDPMEGLGVLHNIAARGLQGLVDETPFANTSDGLSVLDRRFWILDNRLDALGYTDFSDDGFGQRPVLPDLIEEVLDLDDKFRDQRYAWIAFRANRQDGSIQAARRAEGSLSTRLRKQREALARQGGLNQS